MMKSIRLSEYDKIKIHIKYNLLLQTVRKSIQHIQFLPQVTSTGQDSGVARKNRKEIMYTKS